MVHKFKIGQTVELDELRSLAPGPSQIRHLVPSPTETPATHATGSKAQVRYMNGP